MMSILEQRTETPSIKTVMLSDRLDAMPGQFVMVWVPGVDEFPMSVSYAGNHLGVTYQVIGEGTKALATMQPGDMVGIRGPYGRGFEIIGRKLLVVAGGAGMAPLSLLVERAAHEEAEVDLVIGARTRKELLFEARCARDGARLLVCTDDGTKGSKGLATQLAESVMRRERYDSVYACGPERMIVGMMALAKKHRTPMQASLERLMKCGIGVCDSCALDGKHVCRDGPVFHLEELESFKELGVSKLDLTGKRTPI